MSPATSHTRIALALGVLALVAASPAAANSVRGIDVSRFQGAIDWRDVGTTKVRFAFVAASRGSGGDCTVRPRRCGADGSYDRNRKRARAQGIRTGAYHRAFAEGSTRSAARADARAEARVFNRSVDRLRGSDLLPVLDVEPPFDGLNQARLRLWVRTWLDRVGARFGVKPMIYTSASSWQATGDTAGFARAGHKLWVANWGVPSPALPASGWAGRGWSVWQFTSSGSVRGIDGGVDKDRLPEGEGLAKLLVGHHRAARPS